MNLIQKIAAVGVAVTISLGASAQAGTIDAAIYVGNDASFGPGALDPTSLQGYTDILDLWSGLGANASVQNTLDTTDQEVIVVSNPTSNLSAGDAGALANYVISGGLLVLTHNGTVGSLNALTAAMGSDMMFSSAFNGNSATVVDNSSPFMAGLNIGDMMNTFAGGEVTGTGLQVLVEDNLGDALIASQTFGLGTILGVADFDLLNNVATDFFGAGAAQDNVLQFQANLIGAVQMAPIPVPASMPLLAVGFGALVVMRRRKTH